MNETFADKLAYLRAQKGLTQRELAAMTGIAWSMISKYEAGKSKPRLKVLLRLEEALECPGELSAGAELINMSIPIELHTQISEEASKVGMSVEEFSSMVLEKFLGAAMDETLGISPPKIFSEERISKAQARMPPEELELRRQKRLQELAEQPAETKV